MFIETKQSNEDRIAEKLQSNNHLLRDWARTEAQELSEKSVRMNDEIRRTSTLIDAAEREFSK